MVSHNFLISISQKTILLLYRNKSDPECLLGEEEELIEVTIEAITTILQHPHTHKYKNLVKKYAAQILYEFEKILETERNQQEMNKVNKMCHKILTKFINLNL